MKNKKENYAAGIKTKVKKAVILNLTKVILSELKEQYENGEWGEAVEITLEKHKISFQCETAQDCKDASKFYKEIFLEVINKLSKLK